MVFEVVYWRVGLRLANPTYLANTKEDILGFQEWQNSQGDEIYIKIERDWEADEELPKFSGRNEDYFTVRVVIDNTKSGRSG